MFNLKLSSYDDLSYIDGAFHYATCRYYKRGLAETSRTSISDFAVHRNFPYVTYTSDTVGLAWRRLDNRIDTFYGSTYEVPLSAYEVHHEEYRFLICGNIHVMSPFTWYEFKYTMPVEYQPVIPRNEYVVGVDSTIDDIIEAYRNLSDLNEFGQVSYASFRIDGEPVSAFEGMRIQTLEDILIESYPNASITKFGEFVPDSGSYKRTITSSSYMDNPLTVSYISEIYETLNNIVYNKDPNIDIELKHQLPTHILLGDIEHEAVYFNDIVDKVLGILNICVIWGIRLVIVTDPWFEGKTNYNIVRNMIENKIPDDYLLDIATWVKQARDSKYFSFEKTQWFPDYVLNYICDKTIEKWQLPVHRDKYYVSLVCDKITNTSYDDFMKGFSLGHLDHDNDYYTSEFNKLSTIKRENIIRWSSTITQYHVNKYGSGLQSPNLFMNTGQRFVVIVHTGYSDTLWANEQFQANTNYEFLCQTDTCGENYTGRNLINTLPCRRYLSTGSENPTYHSTVYPGTGAPWFVISDDNLNEYSLYKDSKDVSHMLYDCWLTFPDDMNCSITIRVRGNHEQLDNWQSISFGRFPYKQTENYSYSLYCAGGSLGISNDVYAYVPAGGGTKTYVQGNSYDLDFHNVSWGHPATLLNPIKFNGANTSNFRILSIEGIWKNIYAGTQDATVVPYPTAGPPPDYATILGTTLGIQNSDHFIYPTGVSNAEIESSKYINNHGYNNVTGKNYFVDTCELYNTQFIPVMLFFDAKKDHYELCQCATIPNVFCTFDREISSGEYLAQDGSKYLIVPCGWDGRLIAYDYNNAPEISHRFKVINDYWESCDVVDLYESFTLPRAKYFTLVRFKLAIRIG